MDSGSFDRFTRHLTKLMPEKFPPGRATGGGSEAGQAAQPRRKGQQGQGEAPPGPAPITVAPVSAFPNMGRPTGTPPAAAAPLTATAAAAAALQKAPAQAAGASHTPPGTPLAPKNDTGGEEWDWGCVERHWDAFEFESAPPREGALTPPPVGARVEKNFEREVRGNHHFFDGFNVPYPCEHCGRGDLRITPLVRKGTASLQIFFQKCFNCCAEVEVDKWGKIPTQKDVECQVTPEEMEMALEGGGALWWGRNTAEYRKSVVREP